MPTPNKRTPRQPAADRAAAAAEATPTASTAVDVTEQEMAPPAALPTVPPRGDSQPRSEGQAQSKKGSRVKKGNRDQKASPGRSSPGRMAKRVRDNPVRMVSSVRTASHDRKGRGGRTIRVGARTAAVLA